MKEKQKRRVISDGIVKSIRISVRLNEYDSHELNRICGERKVNKSGLVRVLIKRFIEAVISSEDGGG